MLAQFKLKDDFKSRKQIIDKKSELERAGESFLEVGQSQLSYKEEPHSPEEIIKLDDKEFGKYSSGI
jgi:hypothetical protein